MIQMKVKELKYADALYGELYKVEFYCTLDEAWTDDNDTLEAKLFLGLSDEGKKLFAMQHAKDFASEVLEWSMDKFEKFYGDTYRYIIEAG